MTQGLLPVGDEEFHVRIYVQHTSSAATTISAANMEEAHEWAYDNWHTLHFDDCGDASGPDVYVEQRNGPR